jgi:hypothetical protein
VAWLKQNFVQALHGDELADRAHMSPSTSGSISAPLLAASARCHAHTVGSRCHRLTSSHRLEVRSARRRSTLSLAATVARIAVNWAVARTCEKLAIQRCSGRTRFLLIQIFVEADEDSSNVLRLAQVSHRVGN